MAQSPFLPAAVPNKHFPKPTHDLAIPTFPIGYSSGLVGRTFYDQRNGGSIYNQEFDFESSYPGNENVYVWAINHFDIENYGNSIAYEVTESGTGNILYRGVKYFDADVCNLTVGILYENFQYKLCVAYWQPTGVGSGFDIRMRKYIMSKPDTTYGERSGLIFDTDMLVYHSPTGSKWKAVHINMDCNDFTNAVIVWDEPSTPIRMRAYSASTGSFGPVHLLGTSINAKLPDVALSEQVGATGILSAHIVCVDSTKPNTTILKYLVDAGSLMSTTPFITLEDVLPLPKVMDSLWDRFQLKIDAPDHQSSIAQDWAYTFYNNDNNRIQVRMANHSLSPIYQTLTLNDASLIAPSGSPLPDLRAAGNAFPSIAYNPTGDGFYVAWFTTYDPSLPGPLNNPLYHYTANSQGYIGVYIKNDGTLATDAYNRLDDNYNNNRIGNGIDPADPYTMGFYPKTCFSKHNEGEKLFTLFSSHNYLTDLIWNPSYDSTIKPKPTSYEYGEVIDSNMSITRTRIPCGTNYFWFTFLPGTLNDGTAPYLVQKQVDWYPTLPLFRQSQNSLDLSAAPELKLNVAPNPFTESFKIYGEPKGLYRVQLLDISGKRIAQFEGSLTAVNAYMAQQCSLLSSGAYLLNVEAPNAQKQQFKLVKQ